MRVSRALGNGFRNIQSGQHALSSFLPAVHCPSSHSFTSHIMVSPNLKWRKWRLASYSRHMSARKNQVEPLDSSSTPIQTIPLEKASEPVERQMLSDFWIPSAVGRLPDLESSTTTDILERYGFYSTAHAGLFHFLPLGLRILKKLEALIRKHMKGIGACELSLSTLSSVDLWEKSSRHALVKDELFHLERSTAKEQKFLLSPTHEEEITQMVGKLVESYKELPLRLFQITRKYRNEMRARGGLLRAREFVMKDLYTFDASKDEARSTYSVVRRAYENFFQDLKIPVHAITAQSGSMGGDQSHEFQLVASQGEDEIVFCDSCGVCSNTEDLSISASKIDSQHLTHLSAKIRCLSSPTWDETILDAPGIHTEPFLSQDRQTLLIAVTSEENKSRGFNLQVLKRSLSVDSSLQHPYTIFHDRLRSASKDKLPDFRVLLLCDDVIASKGEWEFSAYFQDGVKSEWVPLVTQTRSEKYSIVNVDNGDTCNTRVCQREGRKGTLRKERSIELGHIFNLGDRYSRDLGAKVAPRDAGTRGQPAKISVEMGCHGIGLTRLIGAVAEKYRDKTGLRWPRLMAPFEVLLVQRRGFESHIRSIYDLLVGGSRPIDCVIDDRDRAVNHKMSEARVIGYPLIVDISKDFSKTKLLEVTHLVPDYEDVKFEVGQDELQKSLLDLLSKHGKTNRRGSG